MLRIIANNLVNLNNAIEQIDENNSVTINITVKLIIGDSANCSVTFNYVNKQLSICLIHKSIPYII